MKFWSIPGIMTRVFKKTREIRAKKPSVSVDDAHKLAVNEVADEVLVENGQQALQLQPK